MGIPKPDLESSNFYFRELCYTRRNTVNKSLTFFRLMKTKDAYFFFYLFIRKELF